MDTHLPPYIDSFREMKERFKSRLRIRAGSILQSHNFSKKTSKSSRTAASMATTFAVTRVFKGNVVLAKMSQSLASKAAREQWRKQSGIPGCQAVLGKRGEREGERERDRDREKEKLQIKSLNGGISGQLLRKEGVEEEMEVTASRKGKFRKEDGTAAVETALRNDRSQLFHVAQSFAIPVVGSVCRIFMRGLNRTEVHEVQRLEDAIMNRKKGQALITVCNHVAAMDDPLVLAAMVPPRLMLRVPAMRWTLCATDRCFKNTAMATFFQSVKVLPLVRGEGVDQKGMDLAVNKVKEGKWVHIFPEGSRSRDGGKTLGSMKRGIGRLVADADEPPLVLPFIHSGMENMMPVGSKFPTVGNKVTVLVGEPIPVEDLILECRETKCDRRVLFDKISARVGEKMQTLKEELEARIVGEEGIVGEVEERNLSNTMVLMENAEVKERGEGIGKIVGKLNSVLETSQDGSSSGVVVSKGGSGLCNEEGGWERQGKLVGRRRFTDAEGEFLGSWSNVEDFTTYSYSQPMDRSLFVGFAAQAVLKEKLNLGLSGLESFRERKFPLGEVGRFDDWRERNSGSRFYWWSKTREILTRLESGFLKNSGRERQLGIL